MSVRKKTTERALQEEIEDLEFNPRRTVDGTKCPVCFTLFKPDRLIKRIVGCHHVFHPLCLLNWLDIQPNCPVCRYGLEYIIYSDSSDPFSGLTSSFESIPLTSSTSIAPLFDWSDNDEDDRPLDEELLYL